MTEGKRYGYARVSTGDQDLTVQREALKAAGCTIIREEKKSGTTREGREQLEILLTFLEEGDTLVVTRIDRLARSNIDFQNIYADLTKRGIKFECTEQPIMNTGGALGGFFVAIVAPLIFTDYFELQWGLLLCILLFLFVCLRDRNPGSFKRWRLPAKPPFYLL